MKFATLFPFLAYFAVSTLTSTELDSAEIKSVTPSLIKMRHAEELTIEIKDGDENTTVSISPGGVYIQSTLDLANGETNIAFNNGLIWSNSAENKLDMYAPNLSSELEKMQSINIENKANLLKISQDKLLTIGNQKTLNIYSLNNPNKKLLHLVEDKEILDASIATTHTCFVTSINEVKFVNIKTHQTIKSVNKNETSIKNIQTAPDACVALLENGDIQLWKSTNNRLELVDIYKPSSMAREILVDNEMIIVSNGDIGFTLLQIDSNKLRWLGSYNKLGNIIHAAIDKNDLLVADDRGILTLFDISQPDTPLLISDFPFKKSVKQIILDKKKAYVLTESQLSTVNFKSQSPPVISTLGVNQGGSRRSFIEGNILYVADWFSGMHLYDITIPHAPRLLSSYHTPGSPKGVVVNNNIAYVADDDHGLQVVDVSNPLRPTFISSIALEGLAYTMKLIDDFLYIASHRGGFHIVDVSDAKNLKLVGTYDTPSKSWALEYRNGLLYVADDSSGLMIFNVKNPQQPKLINQFQPGGMAEDIVLKDNKAYIAFFNNGLFILDIADPLDLKQLAHIPTPGNARGIEIHDDLLYLASWEAGVLIIDIENNTAPKIIGQYDTRGATWGLSVKNKIVYAMDWWGGVKVINASDKTKPRLIGKYQTAGKVEDIIYDNNYIFSAHGSRGLQVYDANNDLNPVWATGLDITGNAKQINISADTAIIAAGDGGVVFVDITNPFQVDWLSQISFNTSIDKIASNEELVFALSDNGDLFVINYNNSTTPFLVKRIEGDFQALSLYDHRLFVLNNRQSFDVYDVKNTSFNRTSNNFTLPAPAAYFEINENRLYVSQADNKIAVYDISSTSLQQLSSITTDTGINDIHVEGKQLLATNNKGQLLVFNIATNGQLELAATYQSSHQLNRITTSKYGVFFSGENIIASGKMLPEIEINKVGTNFKIKTPSNMPLGSYHVTTTQTSSSGSYTQHRKINAFKVGFPKLKSKFTMEDFKKKLEQRNFSGQAPK